MYIVMYNVSVEQQSRSNSTTPEGDNFSTEVTLTARLIEKTHRLSNAKFQPRPPPTCSHLMCLNMQCVYVSRELLANGSNNRNKDSTIKRRSRLQTGQQPANLHTYTCTRLIQQEISRLTAEQPNYLAVDAAEVSCQRNAIKFIQRGHLAGRHNRRH